MNALKEAKKAFDTQLAKTQRSSEQALTHIKGLFEVEEEAFIRNREGK